MGARQHLVDRLHRRSRACAVAQFENGFGSGVEHRPRRLERLSCSGRHNGELALRGLHRPPGNWRVEEMHTERAAPRGHGAGKVRRNRHAADDDGPGWQFLGKPVLAEEHGFGLDRVQHHDHQGVEAGGGRDDLLGHRALGPQAFNRLAIHIRAADFVAGTQERSGDSVSH